MWYGTCGDTPAGSAAFFFSSRRRHTRFDCDWSSDVCSSDLLDELDMPRPPLAARLYPQRRSPEIGRASCRERQEVWAVCGHSAGYLGTAKCENSRDDVELDDHPLLHLAWRDASRPVHGERHP